MAQIGRHISLRPIRAQQATGHGRPSVVLPEAQGATGNGQNRNQDEQQPRPWQTFDARIESPEQRRCRGVAARRRCDLRQHETGCQAGDEQAGDGEAGELRQSRDPGGEEREIGDAGTRDAGGQRREDPARGVYRGLAGLEMTEQVDRIILRDAYQRKAEGQCDAVHCGERSAHGHQPGERAAHQR
jgi:hypothetical protein